MSQLSSQLRDIIIPALSTPLHVLRELNEAVATLRPETCSSCAEAGEDKAQLRNWRF